MKQVHTRPLWTCMDAMESGRYVQNPWVEHYLEWGFAVLQVDSFGPRGRDNICGSLFAIPTWHRARDAHAAKRWLLAQPWVAKEDIFLTGFSHGATTVLLTASRRPQCEPAFCRGHCDRALVPGPVRQLAHGPADPDRRRGSMDACTALPCNDFSPAQAGGAGGL